MTTSLQIPMGELDLEAVKAVITDWVVPLLVAEFLAEHKVNTAEIEADTKRRTKPGTRKK